MKLQSYALGEWVMPTGEINQLNNAINGELVAEISGKSDNLDRKAMLEYARNVGGKNLRKFSIHDRGRMLKALAFYLMERKARYYELSFLTGATKMDAWIDVEGGIGTLFTFASKVRREMTDGAFHIDGAVEPLSKENTFVGRHIYVPREGVAVHINAFNFPIWGMLEKMAPSIAGGMPVIIKPSPTSAFVAEAMARDIIESGILPEGSFQFISGEPGDILEHVESQDVVTVTGSAATGRIIRAKKSIIDNSVRLNIESDSLNFSMLGADAKPGTLEFDLFVQEVQREMTIKAGQRCTAIRRALVPFEFVDEFTEALTGKLKRYRLGDPSQDGVKMGPLVSRTQLNNVMESLKTLLTESEIVYGDLDNFDVIGGDRESGAFFPHILLRADDAINKIAPHTNEVFGPVATIMPYKTTDEAIELIKKGGGSLVGSIFTNDMEFSRDITIGTAAYHGRLHFVNRDAIENTGHGSPMPQMTHGGPGRAGGGEELGGIRSVFHFMQRTAIQGHPTHVAKITGEYIIGADRNFDVRHPFTKYFEELEIGDSLTTHKRSITEADIVNFTGISWDNFYAHTDTTSLEGSIFERRVAHGYFIISAAAGLFVNPNPGPVLANYGLDELRFTQPVYAGDTIYTKLTCQSKQEKEKREDEKLQGVVKWLVEVFNQEEELIALATILTLVERRGE